MKVLILMLLITIGCVDMHKVQECRKTCEAQDKYQTYVMECFNRPHSTRLECLEKVNYIYCKHCYNW